MYKGTVIINNEEYVLWYWADEYDMETCVHATPKRVFDKYMKKHHDDCRLYKHNIFIYDEEDFKEMVKEWENEDGY